MVNEQMIEGHRIQERQDRVVSNIRRSYSNR